MNAPLWAWYAVALATGTSWLRIRWRGSLLLTRFAVFLAALAYAYGTASVTRVPHGDPAVPGWNGNPLHWLAAVTAGLALCPAPRRRGWRAARKSPRRRSLRGLRKGL